MKELQFFYKMNPDSFNRHFIEDEVQNVISQIALKPFIYLKDDLATKIEFNADLAIPVGSILKIGKTTEPKSGLPGIALIYSLQDDLIAKLEDQGLLTKLRLDLYIIGLVEQIEKTLFIANASLTNIYVTV